MQYALRALVAVIVAVMLFLLLPPVFHLLQINNGDLMTIFKVVIGFGALVYIVKGKPIPLP